jgi:hypothetical protein
MMLKTAICNDDYWPQRYMFSVERAYENLSHQWGFRRFKGMPSDGLISFHMGIRDLYTDTIAALAKLQPERLTPLFITNTEEYRSDLVQVIASIVYDSLAAIANRFSSIDDEGWFHAIGVFHDVYPAFGNNPAGMNPLQQQLGIRLIAKLRDNIEGMYPSISRVLLSVIGPYDQPPQINTRTAHVIIRDAVYKELQKLPELHARNPDKLGEFLPPNVTYNAVNNTLTHTYTGGTTQTTNLSALKITEVNLTDSSNWQSCNYPT